MYFLVGNAIVDRDDLTVFEKMACVVLARYTGQDAFHDLLTLEVIARKMSVTPAQAKQALEGLADKELILRENANRITQEPSETVSTPNKEVVPLVFESFDGKVDISKTDVIKTDVIKTPAESATSDEILAVFEEVITKRQALILYELAGRNLEALKVAYKIVREDHPFDIVEALSDYLQKPLKAAKPQVSHVESALPKDETEALFEALEKKPKSQVNLSRIHALYQQQKQPKQP